MDDFEKDGEIVDLGARRRTVSIPTLLASLLARRVGSAIEHVQPGQVDAEYLGAEHTIRIRLVNIYSREAEFYRCLGLPVPNYVRKDMDNWKPEF